MKHKKLLKLLQKHFSICEDSPSGLIWISPTAVSVKKGDVAGSYSKSPDKNTGYYKIRLGKLTIAAHQVVLGLSIGSMKWRKDVLNGVMDVCHMDDNGANNRPSNLKLLPRLWNNQMRGPQKGHKYKGIHLHTYKGGNTCYRAKATILGKQNHLGSYSTMRNAAVAYDLYMLEHGCPYAYLNILEREEN